MGENGSARGSNVTLSRHAGQPASGIAVHVGAWVAEAAEPGEVWVSAIVPQLSSGSGIEYHDRGVRNFDGIADEQPLLSVV
jgi:hypothetical protein